MLQEQPGQVRRGQEERSMEKPIGARSSWEVTG